MSSKALRSPGARSESESVCVPPAPVSSLEFRAACARFATGITVVTCLDSEGRPHGMTVNSFTSVSLDPPFVLVSIDLRHAILGHFLACPWFAVNVLAENQENLSHRFSSVSENRFIDVDWHSGESGMPLLAAGGSATLLTLIDSTSSPAGIFMLRYQPRSSRLTHD